MSISKNLTININMRPIPLHKILFSFLKYTQKRTEKILPNYKCIYCSKPGECKKNSFLNTSSIIIKNNWKYTNEDILHHKRVQFAQTYNTFKNWISNYQISLPNTVATTITYITNTLFPSLFVLPSPFPNTWYSSSSTTHQYDNPK